MANFMVEEASGETLNKALMESLKAKLRAWVGKYLMTLAKFPRQKEPTPSEAIVRLVQSTIPK